eukprot:scaffold111137_cov48-Phaeocystis_antarctica.AAC.1
MGAKSPVAPRWRSLMRSAQARAERLTLLVADNTTGYFGAYLSFPGTLKPYKAVVRRGGKQMHLGRFATAEEAALCVARSLEGRAVAAERAAAAAPLTSEEARQQAQAEGLTLRVAENKTGYNGVSLAKPGQPKPYQARVQRGSKTVSLGSFATSEEAALCVARSPEGQAAARAATASVPLTSEVELKAEPPAMPAGAVVKDEEMAPPMPPDAYLKIEVVVKEEERSGSRPKRRRTA